MLAQRREAFARERVKQQGLGRPIQSYPLAGGSRAVVIGRALMVGAWPTFTDFLLDYLASRLGRDWAAKEMARGEDGHPIGQWASKMRKQGSASPGTIVKTTINNAFRSLLSAAYNLYLIEHHYEQYDEPLLERMIKRLRAADGFFATMSEMNAAAYFLRAGFFLKYEDDLRAGHHAEFTATFPATGARFSVEVKTRTGPVKADHRGIDQIKLKNKLSQALKKDLPWTRVVFVDLNIPDIIGLEDTGPQNDLLAQIEDAERTLRIKGAPAPPAYLFVVNQPFHYNLESIEGPPLIGAVGYRLPSFQPRGITTFRHIVLSRETHVEMQALIESMNVHTDPPSTFDGQAPEFAFNAQPYARWIIGNDYVVPGPRSEEITARLQSASANPDTKTMHGIFRANGEDFIVESPMTDDEVAVYKRNPETFFGIVQPVGRRANNAQDLVEFFYESYKNTPKEKLLEFVDKHPQLDQLRSLSQRDLAIFVCEQWALGAEERAKTDKARE